MAVKLSDWKIWRLKVFVLLLTFTLTTEVCSELNNDSLAGSRFSQELLPRGSQRLMQIGPIAIPGLRERWVPQGLHGLGADRFLMSAYQFEWNRTRTQGTNTGPTRVSMISPTHTRHYPLHADGEPFIGHVGGVAVLDGDVLVADGRSIYRGRLPDEPEPIELKRFIDTSPMRASCVTVDVEGRVWVGEHIREDQDGFPPRDPFRDRNEIRKWALIGVYTQEGELEAVLSVRQRLQGIALYDDVVVLSLSYGRRNPAQVAAYKNPMIHQESSGTYVTGAVEVPLYHLDWKIAGDYDIDAMSEEIWIDPETADLWIIFESGSPKFNRPGYSVRGPRHEHLLRYRLLRDD